MKYKRKNQSDFWQLARKYLHDYMPIARSLSDKSVEAYKQSLKIFLLFLETEKELVNEKIDFEAFTRTNIKDFIAWLTAKNCAPKTINL